MDLGFRIGDHAAAMDIGSSEPLYQLASEGDPEKYRALFYYHRVTSSTMLSNLAEAASKLKTLLEDDFGLAVPQALPSALLFSSILVAFHVSKSKDKLKKWRTNMT